MSHSIFSISKDDDDRPLIYRTETGIHMKGCESYFLTKNDTWIQGWLLRENVISSSQVFASAPDSGSTLMEDFNQKKIFFQGEMGEGADWASPAGSLSPLAQASAPDSPWAKKKFQIPHKGRRSAVSLPPSLSSLSSQGGSTLMEHLEQSHQLTHKASQ